MSIKSTKALEFKAKRLEEVYEDKVKAGNMRGAKKIKYKLDYLWDKIRHYEHLNVTSVILVK